MDTGVSAVSFLGLSCPPAAIRDDDCYCYSVNAAVELEGVLWLVHQSSARLARQCSLNV